jgi:hypothetical protein
MMRCTSRTTARSARSCDVKMVDGSHDVVLEDTDRDHVERFEHR